MEEFAENAGSLSTPTSVVETTSVFQHCSNSLHLFSAGFGTSWANFKLIMGTLRSSKGVRTETRRYIVRLFIFRLFLLIFGVGLTVGLTYPSNWFHTALNERNEEEFWWYLWFFIVMVCMTAPIRFLESYISALLVMRFRQILSNMLFDIYMTKRAYYHIKQNTVCLLWHYCFMTNNVDCFFYGQNIRRKSIIRDNDSAMTLRALLMVSFTRLCLCWGTFSNYWGFRTSSTPSTWPQCLCSSCILSVAPFSFFWCSRGDWLNYRPFWWRTGPISWPILSESMTRLKALHCTMRPLTNGTGCTCDWTHSFETASPTVNGRQHSSHFSPCSSIWASWSHIGTYPQSISAERSNLVISCNRYTPSQWCSMRWISSWTTYRPSLLCQQRVLESAVQSQRAMTFTKSTVSICPPKSRPWWFRNLSSVWTHCSVASQALTVYSCSRWTWELSRMSRCWSWVRVVVARALYWGWWPDSGMMAAGPWPDHIWSGACFCRKSRIFRIYPSSSTRWGTSCCFQSSSTIKLCSNTTSPPLNSTTNWWTMKMTTIQSSRRSAARRLQEYAIQRYWMCWIGWIWLIWAHTQRLDVWVQNMTQEHCYIARPIGSIVCPSENSSGWQLEGVWFLNRTWSLWTKPHRRWTLQIRGRCTKRWRSWMFR